MMVEMILCPSIPDFSRKKENGLFLLCLIGNLAYHKSWRCSNEILAEVGYNPFHRKQGGLPSLVIQGRVMEMPPMYGEPLRRGRNVYC